MKQKKRDSFIRYLLAMLLLLAIAITASCGGGGGGGDGGGPTPSGSTTCVWDNPASTWDNCTWGP
ncbi:MAG: hypothetical protein HY265_04270 [Deltaproteobacteria bacterium]|nr:hypothetical protein [Deltaproteobacteria bacterium]